MDYDREMALVVEHRDPESGERQVLAVGRLVKLRGANEAEYAILVNDQWQGQGIGSALLRNLECRAASFGAHRLLGDTLRSNQAMQSLARKAGFAFGASPDDWKLVRVTKEIDRKPEEIPCASWRLAAMRLAANVAPAHA